MEVKRYEVGDVVIISNLITGSTSVVEVEEVRKDDYLVTVLAGKGKLGRVGFCDLDNEFDEDGVRNAVVTKVEKGRA